MITKTYAKLQGNIVVNVEIATEEWVSEQSTDFQYVEITETTGIAHIGGDYINGRFYSEQPYPSWTGTDSYDWIPPVPYPNDDTHLYRWSEEEMQWNQLPNLP